LKKKKAAIPGWGIVVALIIGLAILLLLLYVASKSSTKMSGATDIVKNLFA